MLAQLFGPLPVGDVPAHAAHPRRIASGVTIDFPARGEKAHPAVGPDHAVLGVVRRVLLESLRHNLLHVFAVVRVHQMEQVFEPARECLWLETKQRMNVVVPHE